MRSELKDADMNSVVGGTVIISRDHMVVGFSTLGTKYSLKNVSYRDARNYVEDLKDANSGMSNAEFDSYCKSQLEAKGWI